MASYVGPPTQTAWRGVPDRPGDRLGNGGRADSFPGRDRVASPGALRRRRRNRQPWRSARRARRGLGRRALGRMRWLRRGYRGRLRRRQPRRLRRRRRHLRRRARGKLRWDLKIGHISPRLGAALSASRRCHPAEPANPPSGSRRRERARQPIPGAGD